MKCKRKKKTLKFIVIIQETWQKLEPAAGSAPFGTNMGREEEEGAGEPETGQDGSAVWARGQVPNSG